MNHNQYDVVVIGGGMEIRNHDHYDVVVIGGGPAGSTLFTLLVRQGYRVLVLEGEKFPRFHVGEFLLPRTQLIWEKLGFKKPLNLNVDLILS